MDQALVLGQRALQGLVMNGAGLCKDRETAQHIESAAVVFGSITVQPRAGNAGTVYQYNENTGGSLNSKGLPNAGARYWEQELPIIANLVHQRDLPFIVNIAGFSTQEYVELALLAAQAGADGIELNLGCPNALDIAGNTRHRIPGFNRDLVRSITLAVREKTTGLRSTIGIKVPPYSDPYQLTAIAEMIRDEQLVDFVTTTNTFPNALAFNQDGTYAISVPDGYAGYGGRPLKWIALGQVQQWCRALNNTIPVIGVGGVREKRDIDDFLSAGAIAVQVVTAIIQEGPAVMKRLL